MWKPRKRTSLVCVCGRQNADWEETNKVESIDETNLLLGEPTPFLDPVYLGGTQ